MTQERVQKAVSVVVTQAPFDANLKVQKGVGVVVVQKPPLLDTQKVVAYAVEGRIPDLRAHKVIAYAVEQEITGTVPPAQIGKVVAYAFEGQISNIKAHKIVGYGVEAPDASGRAFQDEADKRPRYRTGALPYVEYQTGDELKFRALFAGEYTLVIHRQDGTFETRFVTMVRGVNVLPVVNFNQMAIVLGRLTVRQIQRIRVSMKIRAAP